jgi:hypothetical protein
VPISGWLPFSASISDRSTPKYGNNLRRFEHAYDEAVHKRLPKVIPRDVPLLVAQSSSKTEYLTKLRRRLEKFYATNRARAWRTRQGRTATR